MDVIHVTPEILNMLDNWGSENKRLFHINGQYHKHYFKKCKVYFDGENCHYYIYVENKQDYTKITLHDTNDKSEMIAKIQMIYVAEEDIDYQLKYSSKTYDVTKDLLNLIEFVSNGYMLINTFFIYGNIIEDREVVIHSKSQGNNKVFTFRKYNDKIYAVQTTAHKSPEGIFSVRGHFRKYKDGKIVWIDEFLKGVNKE